MTAPMMNDRYGVTKGPRQLFRFLVDVLRDFKRNQGLLLCGAVAYYTLLSVVPLSILALIGRSHIVEEEQLFHTLSVYLEMIIPGYAATLTEQVRVFLAHRDVVGVIGFVAMLFFQLCSLHRS
jgi:membrane protein